MRSWEANRETLSAGGVLFALVSLHLVNLFACAPGWYGRILLGGFDRSALRRFRAE